MPSSKSPSVSSSMTEVLKGLSYRQLLTLEYDWLFWGRDKQVMGPSGACADTADEWRTWLILAGRGWGKTRTGAEFIRAQVESGGAKRIALVGHTWADVRDVMIEGESGLLSISAPWMRPTFEISKRRLTWPNGAVAYGFSGCEPDQLRGPQFDCAWVDEIAKFDSPAAWQQLQLALRLGASPKAVVTTTPKAHKWLRELAESGSTLLTTGTTFENKAHLAPAFLAQIKDQYAGTRLGRQEVDAEFLWDTPGALWSHAELDKIRLKKVLEDLDRIVVAVDPAVSKGGAASDETGIVVAGAVMEKGRVVRLYVLADYSLRAAPDQWMGVVLKAYEMYQANMVVAETNQGGALIESLLRQRAPDVAYQGVQARHGKLMRAEPVAALYEQGRVKHLQGLEALEDQMAGYTGMGAEKSPDRLDALVLGLTWLTQPPRARTARLSGF